MNKNLSILTNLRYPNGLFAAASKDVSTGYNMSWIRDNCYAAIGLEDFDDELVEMTYHAMLNIFLKHESKIDQAIKNPPKDKMDYLHARYFPNSLDESKENWGNKQNDMIGLFLFKVGDLTKKGFKILRNENDKKIVQKLVYYLQSIDYYRDVDNGMWEENEEVHSSSVGACLAGLKKIKQVFKDIDVPKELIEKGQETLNILLPRESVTKKIDMALLSLIWPYNVATKEQAKQILENVEKHLVREKGVIRYESDYYYNQNGEAEWTMGFPWLAIIYRQMKNKKKYDDYMEKSFSAMNKKGEMPELYFSKTDKHNENTPLGWAQSLLMEAVKD